jgi:hypothetical protein
MKLPIPESVINNGKEYAEASLLHTHDHAGWEGEQNKADRIARGKTAELFVVRLLEVNGISIILDSTSAAQNDEFDFMHGSARYDIKSTSSAGETMKITRPYERKRIDFFVGCVMCKSLQWIEIKGVFTRAQALDKRIFFEHGEKVRGEKFTCAYKEGAYYFAGPYISFEEHFGIRRLATAEMPPNYWHRLWCFATNKKLPEL